MMASLPTIEVCIVDNEYSTSVSVTAHGLEKKLPGLIIPDRYRPGVVSVGTVTDEQFVELLGALKKSPPSADTAADLAGKLSPDVPSIDRAELEDLVSALASMQGVQKSAHVEVSRFVTDLWDSLVEDDDDDELNEETFKSRVTSLLNETTVQLTSVKVAELRREIERMFCSARVLTDIRTAFGYDTTKRPALTIMHTLEIKYHDDTGELREFYVSVDNGDLRELREAINRAFDKNKTLIDLLQKAEFDLY